MKVGVVLSASAKSGGAHRYEVSVLRILERAQQLDFVAFIPKTIARDYERLFPNLSMVPYSFNKLTFLGLWMRSSFFGFALLRFLRLQHSGFERSAIDQDCFLLYFLSPNPVALGIVDLPIVTTVWDLGHRKIPVYPEISGSQHFKEREHYFATVLPKSVRVVVDSALTREDVINYYLIDRNKVIVGGMPLELSAEEISRVARITVSAITESPYIIYPAHFWPHKRHILLLNAFAKVLLKYPALKLVLTGGDKGNISRVRRHILDLRIGDRVILAGFLEYEQVLALVRDAELLVFPSDLGPTNLPPLEAMYFGTPCVISNVHDQVIYNSPLASIVPEQTVDCWYDYILQVLNAKATGSQGDLTSPENVLTEALLNELSEIQATADEWSNSGYRRIDD